MIKDTNSALAIYKDMSDWYAGLRGLKLYNPFIAYKFKNSKIKLVFLTTLMQADLMRHGYVYGDIHGGIESSPVLTKLKFLDDLVSKHVTNFNLDYAMDSGLLRQNTILAEYDLKLILFDNTVPEYSSIKKHSDVLVSYSSLREKSLALIDLTKIPYVNVRGIVHHSKSLELLPYDSFNRLYFLNDQVTISKTSLFKTPELLMKSFDMLCYHTDYCGFIPDDILSNIYDSHHNPQKISFNFSNFEDTFKIIKNATFDNFEEHFFNWVVSRKLFERLNEYVQGIPIPDYVQEILALNAAITMSDTELETYRKNLANHFSMLAAVNYDHSVLHSVMCNKLDTDMTMHSEALPSFEYTMS